MTGDVSASWDELSLQAMHEADMFLSHAEKQVRAVFNGSRLDESAEATLVAAHVAASTQAFRTMALVVASQNIRDGLEHVSEALNAFYLADRLEDLANAIQGHEER